MIQIIEWWNQFGILAIGYSLERVAGFSWEFTMLTTFCVSPVPHSSRIAHIFGDLSSGNPITWVSEIVSEISILL